MPRAAAPAVFAAVAAALLSLPAAPAQPAGKKARDTFAPSAEEQGVIDATNAERKAAGVPPLKASPKLFEAARAHAANMARQEKMAHELDGKAPVDRVRAAGYRFARTGENVGWNYRTPATAVAGWMASPPHKANMLNKDFTEIGVGVARSEKGEPYWAQVFGTPR